MRLLQPFYFLLATLMLTLISCSEDGDSIVDEGGLSGSITRFVAHNGFLYSLNPNGINTYDLTNPDQPQLTHTLPTDYGLETIIVYDNKLYLGSKSSLYILELSNPARPTILSQTTRGAVDIGNGCDPVVVKGNYAYSTVKIINEVCGTFRSQSQLLTFDIRDAAAPQIVSSFFMDTPNGLGYKDDYLFVCDPGFGGVVIFDISQPEQPRLTEFLLPLATPRDLIIRGDQMVVASQDAFRFYDISDIANIRPLATILL